MTPTVSVALIEDDPAYRTMLAAHLQASPAHRLAGLFASAEDALAQPAGWPAHIALVDLDLPGLSGTEAVSQLRTKRPELRCIVLTGREDDMAVFGALGAGAAGYLLKTEPPRTILAALDELMAGGAPLSRTIARRILEVFRTEPAPRRHPGLTAREEDIIEALCRGRTYKEIALQFGLSVSTVKNHLNRIYEKLAVRSRTEAVVKWLGKKPHDFAPVLRRRAAISP